MSNLSYLGLNNPSKLHWNLSAEELSKITVDTNQGTTNDTGALVVMTGEFTGRSPKDKFIVNGKECDSPHDDVLGAEDICNCSCTCIFSNR